MLKVGDPAPDFEVTDHRGRRVKLSDFRGRKVLLWFYPKASTPGDTDNFGTSVALSGDGNALAVGAPFEDGSGAGIGSLPDELAPDSGAVYFYARSAGTWSQQAYVKASNLPEFNDQFGTSVALSGDGNTLAVGARFEDGSSTGIDGTPDNLAVDAGAVYLY